MKVLLHICCAPCSVECIDILRNENISVTGYWYNPNIHHFTVYQSRLNGLKEYSKMIDLVVIYNDVYGLRTFTKNVIEDLSNRCDYCYRTRLEECAKYAKDNGFDGFSTTLLISPYQKHDKIKDICNEISNKYNIEFIYRDFRPNFREGQRKAREIGIYMQKYCGCIFSEEERYSKDVE
jgi:predicted adenine nucleotide alpha hydrolase (AANH) superfamily ATPase